MRVRTGLPGRDVARERKAASERPMFTGKLTAIFG